MKKILARLCVLGFCVFAFAQGASFQNDEEMNWAEDEGESEVDYFGELKDEFGDEKPLEMPILSGKPYPFCGVRYEACKVSINDECKCKKLQECCENCFRNGVFCRELPHVCLWNSLRCQCGCMDDASDPLEKCL